LICQRQTIDTIRLFILRKMNILLDDLMNIIAIDITAVGSYSHEPRGEE